MSSEDRRAPGTSRIPFEGLVEVGGALGPSFEAQAINVSQDGMLLRTAYLPDAGQPLTCRFDAGHCTVTAQAEVVWRTERGRAPYSRGLSPLLSGGHPAVRTRRKRAAILE